MKYSSSPNLIKHYVPLDFSKGCIDYKQKKNCEKVLERTDENPFKNKKLQKIHEGVKDFVLVFKNKSVQKFKAQKKIAYSPLLKQICFDQERREKATKHKTQLISKKDFLCNYKPKFKLNTNTPHPKTVQPEKNSRKRNLSQRKVRQSQGLQRKSSLKTPTGTLRSTRYSWRGFQEKQNSQELEIGLANQQQSFKSHKSLKIQGNRAPKSETIDYFRKLHKYESGQYFTMGLFNSFQGPKQY